MIVTSDIFDIRQLMRWGSEYDWRENLVCGVGVRGQTWISAAHGAAFLSEAATQFGLMGEMRWANYHREGDFRGRPIKPTSMTKVQQGKLAGARDAIGLLLRGERPAAGAREGSVVFGGIVHAQAFAADGFEADFLFPVTDRVIEDTCHLLRLAATLLGAEYGHSFIRDDFCYPIGFCAGLRGIVYPVEEAGERATEEIPAWHQFARRLWTRPRPLLRDLFEANLISERHTSMPIESLGYLLDWIDSTPGRGRLEDLGAGRWLWTLTDEEVFDTRPHLYEAGLLFAFEKRVYRDLGRETARRPRKHLGGGPAT